MEHTLSHHGIKGMRWGVRRFRRKDGSLTPAGRKRYSEDSLDDDIDSGEVDKSARKRGLTDKQKKALKIGVAVAGTALAAYGTYKVVQLYRGDGAKIDPATGFRLIDKPTSDAENLRAINPGRISVLSKSKNMEIIHGSSTNCMLCTTAYEFRKRGLDVHAGLEKTGRGYFPDELFPKIFKDYPGMTKIANKGTAQDVLSEIESFAKTQGPNSRGNIVCWWKAGGGHSMIWENIDGKIVFKDGQTNQVYDDFGKTILSRIHSSKPVEILRTDNLTIDANSAKKYLNADTALKTYVDHGGEIALRLANDPVIQFAAVTTASIAYGKVSTTKAVKAYRSAHPHTRLSDKDIAKLVSRSTGLYSG